MSTLTKREQLIEAMARAAIIDLPHASVCLSVLCDRIPGLADVIEGKAVIVPVTSVGSAPAKGSEK